MLDVLSSWLEADPSPAHVMGGDTLWEGWKEASTTANSHLAVPSLDRTRPHNSNNPGTASSSSSSSFHQQQLQLQQRKHLPRHLPSRSSSHPLSSPSHLSTHNRYWKNPRVSHPSHRSIDRGEDGVCFHAVISCDMCKANGVGVITYERTGTTDW